MSVTSGTSPDGRHHCFYCELDGGQQVSAPFTVHDKRGCLHVCSKHAVWRINTSALMGHSLDCPHREKT